MIVTWKVDENHDGGGGGGGRSILRWYVCMCISRSRSPIIEWYSPFGSAVAWRPRLILTYVYLSPIRGEAPLYGGIIFIVCCCSLLTNNTGSSVLLEH